jgi:hypothetical protein
MTRGGWPLFRPDADNPQDEISGREYPATLLLGVWRMGIRTRVDNENVTQRSFQSCLVQFVAVSAALDSHMRAACF